jgi:hypothetical protein
MSSLEKYSNYIIIGIYVLLFILYIATSHHHLLRFLFIGIVYGVVYLLLMHVEQCDKKKSKKDIALLSLYHAIPMIIYTLLALLPLLVFKGVAFTYVGLLIVATLSYASYRIVKTKSCL